MFTRSFGIALTLMAASCLTAGAADEPLIPVGAARIDITPDYPIRLTGYAVRKTESEGVEQRLWAKALAIGADAEGPAILLTVDNCGVCANLIDEVAARLKSKTGIPRERIAVCSSHTHSGPCTLGFAPNIFASTIPAGQQTSIERYSKELTDKLEQVALAALADRRPARLAWNEGSVAFARNRRTEGGPVDPALPILCATGLDGQVRAVVANYACHCTTLGGEFNTSGFTNQYYFGATWTWQLTNNLLRPGDGIDLGLFFGPGFNDGLIASNRPNRKALGSHVLFREALELGYWVTPAVEISAFVDHVSNGGLAKQNQSINDVGGRVGVRF